MKVAALLLSASVLVLANAQTNIQLTEVPVTPTTTPTLTQSIPNAPSMIVECWQQTVVNGQSTSIAVATSAAAALSAECWEVYASGGGIHMIPITVTNPDFAPTADAASTTSQSTASSSSSNKVAILVPAILGSLFVVLLAVAGYIWHLRKRQRRGFRTSRAWQWQQKHVSRDSWSMDKKAPVNAERAPVHHERYTSYPPPPTYYPAR